MNRSLYCYSFCRRASNFTWWWSQGFRLFDKIQPWAMSNQRKRIQGGVITKLLDIVDESNETTAIVAGKIVRKRKLDTSVRKMGGLLSKKSKKATTIAKNIQLPPNLEITRPNSTTTAQQNISIPNDNGLVYEWDKVDYIQETNKLNKSTAEAVVELFNDDNTVPFIARYRRAQTGGLDADELRKIKESYDRVSVIKHKADLVIKAIEKAGKWTPEIHNTVKSLKTIAELEHIHALYKTATRSLAERAREIGLGTIAAAVVNGDRIPNLKTLINPDVEGLQDEEKIKDGIISILADTINKDKRTFDKIKELREKIVIQISTKKTNKSAVDSKANKNKSDDSKYEMYYDWCISEKNIKSHHVLAIKRAEAEKIISVQISIPQQLESMLKKSILEIYDTAVNASQYHTRFIVDAFHQAYKKSISPAIIRRMRSELNEKAMEESMEVFAVNVKQLFLMPPVRGKTVLGIDPGFTHGCKLAVVSAQGEVLETATIYPHTKAGKSHQDSAANKLASLVRKYHCTILALGNATACRETEEFISNLIQSGLFNKQEVDYTIVNEAGASIYSCSVEAKAEFPTMDYNVISAVSIARRLQDPLAELVKVEPKHLGVGQYQHDLPEKQLLSKLNEVVMEAVSFVGVDVNTASHSLLKRVAGLNDTKATNIINWRKDNGPFTNREQLHKVKGIGAKTFEQCAGFIRILPETAQQSQSTKTTKFNLLDQTWIHPESYKIANAIIKSSEVDVNLLGSREFISAINIFAAQGLTTLASKFKTNEATLEIIIKGLTMARGEDIRNKFKAPLFRNSLRCMRDLEVGVLLTGEVRNVTNFGAFVDVGVERDGLIHKSSLDGESLVVGQRVDVKVKNIEKDRGRLGLILITRY